MRGHNKMNSEDYITQHFPPRPSQKGAKENTDAYNCRIYWFKNDFPTYNEIAEHFNFNPNRIKNYANKYNWKLIRENYEELKTKEDLKKIKKNGRKWERNIDTSNELQFKYNNKRMEHLLFILGEFPNRQPKNRLNKEEEDKARKELNDIFNNLNRLQPLIRTNNHLPNNYNDKFKTENNTKIDGDVNMVHFHKKTTEEVLKENESEIREFIKRTAIKEDSITD